MLNQVSGHCCGSPQPMSVTVTDQVVPDAARNKQDTWVGEMEDVHASPPEEECKVPRCETAGAI